MSLIPNDWSVAGGTWDSEITRVTSPAWAGGSSIQFDCPGSLADLQMVCGKFPVYPGQPIRVSSWFRADSTAADDWTYNGIDWLNAAEAVFQEDINYANAAAANTWQELAHVFIAPSGAAWAQLLFGQVSDDPSSQFVSNVGTCEATPLPRCARIHTSAASTAATGSPQAITLDVVDYDYGGFVSGSTFIAPATGVYAIIGNVAGYATGGTEGFFQANLYSTAIGAPAGANTYMKWGVGASSPLPVVWQGLLVRGDQIALQFTYSGGLTGIGYNGNTYNNTWLSIVEVKA